MTLQDKSELAQDKQGKTPDATPNGRRSMRKSEVRLTELFKLVRHDYVDSGKKSLGTLDIHINNHLGPFFGDRSAERLRVADIEQYKEQRRKEGAKQSTINLELAALRRAFSLAHEKEIIINRPKVRLYSIGKTNRRRGFFEHSEYEAQLAALPPFAKQVLRFGYRSGWREGEIFGLTWEVNYDKDGQSIVLPDSKSGHGRVLPLRLPNGQLTEAGLVIEEQKDRRVKGCPYIFHRQGRQIHRSTFNKTWHKACSASGVQRHFHDLRRTVVRNLTRSGVHRTIAKALTGHETDDVFERYDIVDQADLKEAISKMFNYLNTRKNGGNNDGDPTSSNSSDSGPVNSPVSNGGKTQAMAEREGFEPSGAGQTPHDFQSEPSSQLTKIVFKFWSLFSKK